MATKRKENPRGLRAADPDARREAARLMGSATTEAKRAAAQENGRKAPPGPGRPFRPILETRCTCGAGSDTVIGEGHKARCPRYLAIRRRRLAGVPIE